MENLENTSVETTETNEASTTEVAAPNTPTICGKSFFNLKECFSANNYVKNGHHTSIWLPAFSLFFSLNMLFSFRYFNREQSVFVAISVNTVYAVDFESRLSLLLRIKLCDGNRIIRHSGN